MLTKLVLLLLLITKVKLDNNDDLVFNELSVKDNNKEINNKNNYLSYNLKSNNSDLQTIEILSLNYNETYEELLSKISNNCISIKELKELHKDKSTFIFSSILFPFLVDGTTKEIGLNELRKGFHMKTQKVNYKGKEEFEDKNKNDTEGALKHFQNLQKVGFFFMIPQLFYRPDDVENTTKFFDKKFPEVRKLFQLKYEEKGINNLAFNNKTVEKMYLEYMDMRLKTTKAVDNSYLESVKILHGQESKNCFDKNQNNTMEVSDLWEKK